MDAINVLQNRKELMLNQVLALENGLRNLDSRIQALAARRTLALNFTLPLDDASQLRGQYANTPTPPYQVQAK